MTTRNFWIAGSVDGINTRIGTGPRSKDGGFELNIKMREDGEITTPLRIEGRANEDGTLTLLVSGDGFSVTDDAFGVMLRKVGKR